MQILLRRDNAFTLFRDLNKAILTCYIQLKNRYEAMPPLSAEIIDSLKTWKNPMEEVITRQILKIIKTQELPEGLTQTLVLAKIVQNYKEEQQFIELFRNLNSSIETIKDFIRTHALRDTSKDSSSN